MFDCIELLLGLDTKDYSLIRLKLKEYCCYVSSPCYISKSVLAFLLIFVTKFEEGTLMPQKTIYLIFHFKFGFESVVSSFEGLFLFYLLN